MSQKSPKSPVSNSPSCDEILNTELQENQRPRSAIDQLQRQVEEELRQSNRLLVAIDGLIAESKGSLSRNYIRSSSAQGENVHKTPSKTYIDSETSTSSPRVPSVYAEEMEGLELPSPQSAITYASRGQDGPREESERETRLPSPEGISLKSKIRLASELKNLDSSNVDSLFDETSYLSPAIFVPSAKSCRVSSCTGNTSRVNYFSPQEQHSFEEDISSKKSFKPSSSRFLNESSESSAQPLCSRSRGVRLWELPKETMMRKSKENHYNICSQSPVNCPMTQFPTFKGGVKSAKIENDHYHNHESPHDFHGRDEKAAAALGHLSQLKKTPSYFRCGLQQGTEFLNVCSPKGKDATIAGGKIARLPKTPCLKLEDIDDLIKCETKDVESAWYLTSDEKKTHKKPCPKQQKAQMTVKNLVKTYTTQAGGSQIYTPLEHPDPEDFSPEVTAAMMFSQEQGIGMEECPNAIISHLFPDEPKLMIPEKGSVSVVDPNLKDQDEMIEKSAAVPSEGVSDSAYTRIMRNKGENMKLPSIYEMDFAICQQKPEYVLVPQKPQRISKVQFRGNSLSWFPGFFSAFPDDEGLKVVSSPSRIFHKAWVHSNPENVPASDLIVLE